MNDNFAAWGQSFRRVTMWPDSPRRRLRYMMALLIRVRPERCNCGWFDATARPHHWACGVNKFRMCPR